MHDLCVDKRRALSGENDLSTDVTGVGDSTHGLFSVMEAETAIATGVPTPGASDRKATAEARSAYSRFTDAAPIIRSHCLAVVRCGSP